MKKVFIRLICLFILSILFLDCSSNGENLIPLQTKNKKDLLLGHFAYLKLLSENNYTSITEEEMKATLDEFLQGSIDSRSDSEVIKTEKIDKLDILVTNKNSNETRNVVDIEDVEVEEISLYLYSIKKSQDNSEGFAITSTDLRIGTILAVVEEGSFDYFKATDFMPIFSSGLYDYVDEIFFEWDNLKSETRAINDILIINEKNKKATNYKYSNFRTLSQNLNSIMKTEWNQGVPYCNYARAALGRTDIVSGCTPVALGQIISHLEIVDSNIDYEYQWNLIKSKKYPCNEEIENQIGYMLYKLALGMGSSFGTSTSTQTLSMLLYLNNQGYSYNSTFYNFTDIKSSVDSGKPVLVNGTDHIIYNNGTVFPRNGHSWVIDAYKRCNATVTDLSNNKTSEITDYFVHCNMGWGGYCNGYYRDDIFYTRNIPDPDYAQPNYQNGKRDNRYIFGFPHLFEEYLSDYYKYNVTIVTKLSHK